MQATIDKSEGGAAVALDRFVRPIRLYVTPMHVCGHGDDCHTEWEAAAVDANDTDVRVWVFDWIGHAIHAACKFAERIGVSEVYISDGKTLTHKVDVKTWLHQDVPNWPGLNRPNDRTELRLPGSAATTTPKI